MRKLLPLIVLLQACSQGTYVSLTLSQSVTSPPTTSVELALMLEGRAASASLSEKGGSPLVFPTSVALRIGSGAGSLTIHAIARDATSAIIDEGDATVQVARDATVNASLELGGGGGGADLAGNVPDLTPGGDGGGPRVPGAPTQVVASSGNGLATLLWMAPADTGSDAIVHYTVTSSPGNIAVTTADATTQATVTGLTNGTAYTFTVTATNGVGTGPASAPSNAVTPTSMPMVPAAPTGVSAVADVDKGAHVSWTAADNRGSPLTQYTITANPAAGSPMTVAAVSTSATFTGLTAGTSYTFTVTATNGIGESAASAPSNAITAATLPQAPTGVTALPNVDHGATVSWTAPADTGFSPIGSYIITAMPGGATASTPDGATTSWPIAGLNPGQLYTFTVVARNLVGDSAPSAASSPITIEAKLAAPANVVGCGADGQLRVRFDAVSGAASYDVFYSSTIPATSGTKVNVSSSPATVNIANGSYYVSVAAVNDVGDGIASADQAVALSSQVHDALFVGTSTGIDIYDCYSKLANGATPSRTLLPNVSGFSMVPYSPFAVDGTNAVIFVSDYGNSRVRIFLDATKVNGSTVPTYTLGGPNHPLGGPAAAAVDPAHKAFYVHENGGAHIKRFNYTNLTDLNGDIAESAILNGPSSFSTFQLYVNPANGDLWGAYYHNTAQGGGSLFAAAYGLPNPSSPTKTLRLTEAASNNDFQGITYSPQNGGTIYLCNGTNNSGLRWLTGVDALAGGTYSQSGYLAGSYAALALAGSRILAYTADSVATVASWDVASISGSSTKTVASAHSPGGGVVYLP